MLSPGRRPLARSVPPLAAAPRSTALRSPAGRALVYGIVGSLVEAAFTTSTTSVRSSRPILRGPSTLWMAPIYGLAMPLFEPVHDRLRSRPAWQRGLAYAGGIFAVEGLTGWALRRLTGRCPWDYSGRSRLALAGLIRLDYAPLWALTGLGAERVHDALIESRPAGPSSSARPRT